MAYERDKDSVEVIGKWESNDGKAKIVVSRAVYDGGKPKALVEQYYDGRFIREPLRRLHEDQALALASLLCKVFGTGTAPEAKAEVDDDSIPF